MLIDSHAHLTDERFADDLDATIERAAAAGVQRIVTIGSDVEDSRAAVALAERKPEVYATVGIHPHVAAEADAEAFPILRALAASPRVVAIGEMGLDFFYDNSPREAQREAFIRQLRLARELELPAVVHTREADEQTETILRQDATGVRGVLHCFTGGRQLMETALELGWYISFSGLITFGKYADAELLRAVPAERFLVETDSPYLAPAPHRGKRNEPAYVARVAARAAELRGDDPKGFAALTARNAREFYRLG